MKHVRKVALASAWRVAVQSRLLNSTGRGPVTAALPEPQLLAWKRAQHPPHRAVGLWRDSQGQSAQHRVRAHAERSAVGHPGEPCSHSVFTCVYTWTHSGNLYTNSGFIWLSELWVIFHIFLFFYKEYLLLI